MLLAAGCPVSAATAQLDQDERESIETAPLDRPNSIYTVETAPEIDGVLEELWQDGTPLSDSFRQVEWKNCFNYGIN